MRTMYLFQECREAVGGMGYKTANRIGYMRSDHDIVATFEGDNVVLMQTVSSFSYGGCYLS